MGISPAEVGDDGRVEAGIDPAGADRVHRDPLGGEFEGERGREGDEAALGGSIGGAARSAAQARDRGGVDNRAARGLREMGDRGAAGQEGAAQVDGHETVPVGGGRGGGVAHDLDARDVDQDVEAAEGGDSLGDHAGGVSLLRDIAGDRGGTRRAGGVGDGGGAVGQREAGAFGGKAFGHGAADAGGAR